MIVSRQSMAAAAITLMKLHKSEFVNSGFDQKTMNDAVPVIDISLPPSAIARAWHSAFATVGFCRVVNHGLDASDLRRLSLDFFAQPLERKAEAAAARYGLNGYSAKGQEAVGKTRDVGSAAADPVESLVFNRNESGAKDKPQLPAELSAAAWKYYGACEELTRKMMRVTALGLGWKEDFFDAAYERPSCALRLANYDTANRGDEFLYKAHTDYTGFTLLDAEPIDGLEIRLPGSGEWVAVGLLPGSLVVNSGDLIRQWSDDALHSTLHRVRNVGLAQRSAVVFFSGPHDDTLIETRRYAPVRAGEHLAAKLRASNTT